MKHSATVILTLFASSAQIQRKRAYLTIAAIAWGTVAILLLLAFGEGLRLQLDKNRRAMGENIAILWPGETSKGYKGLPIGRPIRPTIDDVQWLRERIRKIIPCGSAHASGGSLEIRSHSPAASGSSGISQTG